MNRDFSYQINNHKSAYTRQIPRIELQIPLFSDRAGSLLHQEANKERVFNEN